MSKEHKNKRDTKKTAAKSPKEKKAEKLERKRHKGAFDDYFLKISLNTQSRGPLGG